jgi:hypothetical protein
MVQECEELILNPNLRLEAPLNSKYLVRIQTEGSIIFLRISQSYKRFSSKPRQDWS